MGDDMGKGGKLFSSMIFYGFQLHARGETLQEKSEWTVKSTVCCKRRNVLQKLAKML